MAKIDRPILLEIVRIVSGNGRVPEQVRIQKRRFSITYLDDHKQRIEEALRRQDTDRLNMLYGQLESKIKYQQIRASRSTAPVNAKRDSKVRGPQGTQRKAGRVAGASRKAAVKKAVSRSTARAKGPASRAKTAAKSSKLARPRTSKKAKSSRRR